MHEIDDAIRERADDAVELLTALVRASSTIGREGGAQEVLALALGETGFDVERLQLPLDIASDPLGGVQQVPYEGRYDLVGRRRGARGNGTRRSLLLNGHMDVVPAEDAGGWTVPPFAGTVRPGWLTGDLTILSAIEEECTGNGTLAACRAGVLADAALLLEPTDLEVLLAGIGIVWVDVVVHGLAGHAEASGTSVNPILLAPVVLGALDRLEAEMNEAHRADPDPVFAHLEHPYRVNVGRLESGLWPSSVPEAARFCVRVGHPGHWSSEEAVARVDAVVQAAAAADPWLREHPPVVRAAGYRAERYAQDPDTPLVAALAAAHADVHGVAPATTAIASTTDARYYVNRFGTPAAAYGPRVRNMHGVDEAVEIASILECASTVARLLLAWFGDEG